MDKIRDIETFVQVVSCKSFAAAAKAQQVTPVMVSRRMSQLEARLGGKLFHRSTRSLELTREGRVFHEHCLRVLSRLEAAERLVSEARHRATGHLIVTASASFGRRHVAPHLRKFMQANPDVRISLNLSDHVVDLVRAGYDLGIRIGGLPDPSLTIVNLAPNPTVVCAAPDYLDRHGVPIVPEDLFRHNCLASKLHGGPADGWKFRVDDRRITIRVAGNLACSDGAALRKWAVDGLGLARLPRSDIALELASGRLVTVLEHFMVPEGTLMAVHPRQRNLPAKTALFIDFLKGIYSCQAYWMSPGPHRDLRRPSRWGIRRHEQV